MSEERARHAGHPELDGSPPFSTSHGLSDTERAGRPGLLTLLVRHPWVVLVTAIVLAVLGGFLWNLGAALLRILG